MSKTRIANAFRAMKDIGISEDKVKPVLKKLLKVFDKNWELIEADNYSALADAIFEKEEAAAEESPKKIVNSEAADHSENLVNSEIEDDMQEEAEASEELERPFKRIRRKDLDGQSSSSHMSITGVIKTPIVMPNEEPNIPEKTRVVSQVFTRQSIARTRGKQPISPLSLVVHEGGDPCQPSGVSCSQQNIPIRTESRPSRLVKLSDREKGPVSPEIQSKKRRQSPESSSLAICLKEPIVEPDAVFSSKQKSSANVALIKPKDEPVIHDIPLLEAPITVIHPDPSNGGDSSSRDGTSRLNHAFEPPLSQSVTEAERVDDTACPNKPRNNGKLAIVFGERSSNLEIASSPSGEVKIFLSCDLALGRPDFKLPSLEAVLESVEDKYLRPYQASDPNLSVMNLMKEMCQCILKLGRKANGESSETTDVPPTVDLQGKSCGADTLGAGDPFSSLNGSVDTPSNVKMPLSLTPICSHSKGIDDGSQAKKDTGGDENGTDGGEQDNCAAQNNLSLMVVQQPQLTPETIESVHDVVDLAKGQEKVLILLVNQVNEECPPSFFYIPQNAVFSRAHVDFSLARIGDNNCCSTCFGDCLTLGTACACAHETGGVFAYTTDGLVKEELLNECISMKRDPKRHQQSFCKECPLERLKNRDIIEPCKGHLTRKFIKECWWKCGCGKQCGNRVVQRGIIRNLQVFMTPEGKGWGLRTLEDLPKGSFVCELVGEVLTTAELFDRVLRSQTEEKHSYPVFLDADWCEEAVLKDEDALCLDATYYGNIARFINHRCYDSNLVDIPVEVETPDHHYYHIAFFTTREVKAMEELTWDYGIDFNDHDRLIKAFHCQCGSNFCRSIMALQ